VQKIPTREVKYDEVRDTLEKHEDPCPADASEQVSFCYALLGEVAKGGEDAAPPLGHIMTGCSGLDEGLDAYRREFLRPLVAYIDACVSESERKRSSRSKKLVRVASVIVMLIAGGLLTKFGEWLWTVIAG
jgi:hypothetical protein